MDCVEGKLLKDLEEVNNLQCTITEPTRVTAHSKSLLDVILTHNPDLFKKCGAYQQNTLHMSENLSFRLIRISGYVLKSNVKRIKSRTVKFENKR